MYCTSNHDIEGVQAFLKPNFKAPLSCLAHCFVYPPGSPFPLSNHVQQEGAQGSTPAASAASKSNDSSTKLPIARTQSASVYAGPKATPSAASSTNNAAGPSHDEGPASLSISRSFSAGSPTNASEPSSSSAATSSPSRESRERAEEVARKVVSEMCLRFGSELSLFACALLLLLLASTKFSYFCVFSALI